MNKNDFIFKYRSRNWPAQNRALGRRRSLMFWVDEQAVSGWLQERAGAVRGRPRIYADAAIKCTLVVKAEFHLSLRPTPGFLESVVVLTGVALPVPDYSTVCRRQNGTRLGLTLAPSAQPRHVAIDTKGLKV